MITVEQKDNKLMLLLEKEDIKRLVKVLGDVSCVAGGISTDVQETDGGFCHGLRRKIFKAIED